MKSRRPGFDSGSTDKSRTGARPSDRRRPKELSAMKYTLPIFLLLIVSPIAVAQTPTRDRRSNDNGTATESSAVRERVVGPRSANHAAGQKPSSVPLVLGNPDQKKPDTTWGNTAVIVRPTETPRPSLVQPQAVANKVDTAAPAVKETRKLIQPTSLITALS